MLTLLIRTENASTGQCQLMFHIRRILDKNVLSLLIVFGLYIVFIAWFIAEVRVGGM